MHSNYLGESMKNIMVLARLTFAVLATLNASEVVFAQSGDLVSSEQLTAANKRPNFDSIMTAQVVGGAVKSGGLYIYPSASLAYGRNDNLLSAYVNPLASSYISLRPAVVGEIMNSGDRYTLSLNGEHTKYKDSSADNFTNTEVKVAGDNTFDASTRLGWAASHAERADPRGGNDRALSASPDKYKSNLLAGLFRYGANGATGRFEVDASSETKRYTNNRTTTVNADVDLMNVSGRFYYRLAPKTSMLFELKSLKADYKFATSPNDNTDNRVLVGLTWDATAATTGVFKVGHSSKKFSRINASYSGISWDGQVRWVPLTYSTVDVSTSKAAADSTGFGDYLVNRNVNLTWTHNWTGFFSSRVFLGTVNSDFANVSREDETKTYGAGVRYNLNRYLNVVFDVTRTQRSSNAALFDFKRNSYNLSLEGTL
jgi:hypothetical protein